MRESGGGSSFLACDFFFSAEPVVQLVTVHPTACLVEFLRALADLVFEFLWFVCHGRWRFFRGVCVHGVTPSGRKTTLEHVRRQLPRNGAATKESCLACAKTSKCYS